MLALERWEKPGNVGELRGLSGLQKYYSGYVQTYASIATPLIEMLKNLPKHKNGKKIGLTWNAKANEAFLQLKRAVTDIVPLQLADWDKDFVLTPDASNLVVGAALQQEGSDGALRPLAFFSRKLSGSQLNWSPRENKNLRHSGGTSEMAWLSGEQASGGPYGPPYPWKLGKGGPQNREESLSTPSALACLVL